MVKRREEKVLYSLVFSTCSITIMLLLPLLFPFLFLACTTQSFRIVFLPLVVHVWELNEDKGEAAIRIEKKGTNERMSKKSSTYANGLNGCIEKGENVCLLPGLQSNWASELKHACRGCVHRFSSLRRAFQNFSFCFTPEVRKSQAGLSTITSVSFSDRILQLSWILLYLVHVFLSHLS